jgi:manganese oxidase
MRGGKGQFGVIDMGGMFTILKVRDNPETEGEAWYRHPEGSVATTASAADMAADGIDPDTHG